MLVSTLVEAECNLVKLASLGNHPAILNWLVQQLIRHEAVVSTRCEGAVPKG
jgi:hypothetical protein